MKPVVIIVAAVAVAAAAFWGGTLYANSAEPAGFPGAADGTFTPGQGAGLGGGPMSDLSEEERAEFQSMADEERQAFMEERFGADAGSMPGGGARGARGGLIEGEVLDIAEDALTLSLVDGGGSQTIYLDADTVTAYTESGAELAAGAYVLVFAEFEADGVQTAQAIVVK